MDLVHIKAKHSARTNVGGGGYLRENKRLIRSIPVPCRETAFPAASIADGGSRPRPGRLLLAQGHTLSEQPNPLTNPYRRMKVFIPPSTFSPGQLGVAIPAPEHVMRLTD